MKKRCISVICMLLALLMALPAAAEPIISNSQGYTAYIGENNYLYLTDPDGVTKVLQTPIANLDGMTDLHLYCAIADGRRYEVKLDGSSSRVLAATEEIIWPADDFSLEEGVLIPRSASGVDLSGIPNVEVACATHDELFYVTPNGMGGYALMSLPLPIEDPIVPAGKVLAQVSKPLSITASPETVAIVSENGLIAIYGRATTVMETLTRTNEGMTHAFACNGKLVTLSLNEEGQYTVLSSEDYTILPPISLTPVPVSVATATPVVTAAPTATPKPTTAPSVQEDDGRISKGDTGSAVRKMQRRLLELGYPVGTVDGDFGENTLLAVNLFQCAIGYRNRTYASQAMLNRLYGKNAPAYDLYAPLKEGDEGADVKIMQTFLDALDYDLGEKGIDGNFGKDTKAAVEQFQFVAGMEVTGEADAETLLRLYDEKNPIPNATATPEPAPSDPPTQAPTDKPTQAPTDAPTQPPVEDPTTPTDL